MDQLSSPLMTKLTKDFITLCSRGSLKQALRHHGFGFLHADPNLFSHLLRGCYIPKKSLAQAQQLHAFTITSGASFHRFLSNHLLHMYSKLEQLPTALALFSTMPNKNIMSSNILMGGFIHSGDLYSARRIFDKMPERNLASWNAMVTGTTHFGFNEEALELFAKMRTEGFKADEFSVASALRCSAGLKDPIIGRQIHSYIIQSGFQDDLCVASSVTHMYMKCGCPEQGERVLKGMSMLNVVSFNTIIAGRVQNADPEGALNHFFLMKATGFAPDDITFVSAISSCSALAFLSQGQQVHAQVIKAGADMVVPVRSSLVSMYSRCGCLHDSSLVFYESEESDLVLWSAMIAAYGFHGHGMKAVELFEKKVRGGDIEPTEVTFLSLLYACSHSGLKDKGLEYFSLMKHQYKLEPSLKHYTCIVDLLGRSGYLNEAEALIKSMPHVADDVIWKTLLFACKTHKNVELAERVAENVMSLNPWDSASYVLLSNIRASAERWAEASDVRKTMKERRVRKDPGVSWMQFKGQVHLFSTDDQSHPRQRQIDMFLRDLMGKIRQGGYVPDTSMVLHDMDGEEKERSLAQHSEKLAIAFAMLSLPAEAPIRVMKNLRICNDCHVAIKFMSKVTDREIVVRDTSRFHHFTDGKCSCGDYW